MLNLNQICSSLGIPSLLVFQVSIRQTSQTLYIQPHCAPPTATQHVISFCHLPHQNHKSKETCFLNLACRAFLPLLSSSISVSFKELPSCQIHCKVFPQPQSQNKQFSPLHSPTLDEVPQSVLNSSQLWACLSLHPCESFIKVETMPL